MFSKTAQYAINALIFMTENAKDESVSASYLHKELDIPYKYLTAIMTKLTKSGIIASERGRYGGFTFSRDPGSIYLINILDALGENQSDKCILGRRSCRSQKHCSMHSRWMRPKREFDSMLNHTTLEDLKQDPA